MASHEHRLTKKPAAAPRPTSANECEAFTLRFAGDAGDGMQLAGMQFAAASAIHGNSVCTLPDPPAEIRAPAGTLAGVSGFQVHVSADPIHTPGDRLDALVAMNPAALKANLPDVESNGLLIVNADGFTLEELEKAGYRANPLTDGSLTAYRIVALPMNHLNREAVARVNLSPRETERCKSFFVLGLCLWIFDRPLEPTLRWIRDTYAKNPAMIEASSRTLKAGYLCGEAMPALGQYHVGKVEVPPGRYRQVSGMEALSLGLLTAAHQAKTQMVFAGFPQSPANELLHQMYDKTLANVTVVQAEDDLAALHLALGAAFGGAIGVTVTTGPGMALQADALGLAVMSELPCVVIDIQRPGPSTGMPGKVEQSDLLLALHGRQGECPLIVLAMATPADGFAIILEAVRLAIRSMAPVVVLADAYVASGAERWRVPAVHELPQIKIHYADVPDGNGTAAFQPYERDDRLARPWAIPGTPGLEHRTGGLEKEALTGNVSFDPVNHETMVKTRAHKVALVADDIPSLEVLGPTEGDLLVLGWGSTYGAILAAADRCRRNGMSVASAHLRHLSPLPGNVGAVLERYRRVLVPELNSGQLRSIIRSTYFVDAIGLNKIQGRPFLVREIETKISDILRGADGPPASP